MTQIPWLQGRGLERLLAKETNISDLIQFLTDLDSSPWQELLGFIPKTCIREARTANHADLFLSNGIRKALIEIKLGHIMDSQQQGKYEALGDIFELYLAALTMDQSRVRGAKNDRWGFISLTNLFTAWSASSNETARALANQAVKVLHVWDSKLSSVFVHALDEESSALEVLDQKFLARIVTRRIESALLDRRLHAYAGVTSGGGLPLVQAWLPIRSETPDRSFIAEVRWWETKPGGELRFGVDFSPRPNQKEDEEVRRAAFDLAERMSGAIDFIALKDHLKIVSPRLAQLLDRKKNSRPKPAGDWEEIIHLGFAGAPPFNIAGKTKKKTRLNTRPAFYGDGALRFQAIADIDFTQATAQDLSDLIGVTLNYLSQAQPIATKKAIDTY